VILTLIALKKQKSVGFFLLRMNPQKLIKRANVALAANGKL
jgi:hypothetical protein